MNICTLNNSFSTMSRKYKFHNPDGVYFVTFSVKGWADVFIRNEYKNILLDNLKYCQQNKGLEIFAWCIMSSHVELWSNAVIDQKLEYIHQNPVEEGLVFRAEDYMYSSAVDYAGGKGLLDITLIE